MEQHYKFNPKDYDNEGTNTHDGKFFLDLVGEWESDFHDRNQPFKATHVISSISTMNLIKLSLDCGSTEDCGMELLAGEVDLDKNLEMEKYSPRTTIFGIGSKLDEDEPLLLVRDETMADGLVILKYIPESDEDDVSPEVPVFPEYIRFQLSK